MTVSFNQQSLTAAFQKCRSSSLLISGVFDGAFCLCFVRLTNGEQALCEWSCACECHLLLRHPLHIHACSWQIHRLDSCFVCTFTVCVTEWHSLSGSCRVSQAWSCERLLSANLVNAACMHKHCHATAPEPGPFAPQLCLSVKSVTLTGRTLYAQTDRRRPFFFLQFSQLNNKLVYYRRVN